jgi:hypothetical protein
MKLPPETVMKLPIQDRRYFIQKHNDEQAGIRAEHEKQSGMRTLEGEAINDFARNEQENIKNRKRGG